MRSGCARAALRERAVERHDVDLGAGGAQPVGQRVARLLGARHERAGAVQIGRQRLEQALGQRALGDDVGDDPDLAQRGGGAGADRGDASTPASARASPPQRSSSSRGAFGEVTQTRS